MNVTMRSGGLRWTLLSFAAIGIVVWISAALLVRATAPAVTDLMVSMSAVLNAGADTLDESSIAVERGGTLMGGLEPGLNATADGLMASAESLQSTRNAISEMSVIFADLGASLEQSGQVLSQTPSLRRAGQSLTDAGESMNQVAAEMSSVQPELDDLIVELREVQQVVIETAGNTPPLVEAMSDTKLTLTDTGAELRNTAVQLDDVRNSGTLRFALIMLFALLGTISISLAVIAASRLTQIGLVQQVAESAINFPQTATQTARRMGTTIERSLGGPQQREPDPD